MKKLLWLVGLVWFGAAQAAPVTTEFSYQGELTDAAVGVDGFADFQFTLWDAAAGGTQLTPTVQIDAVPVVDGRFTVQIDFGDEYDGDARWLGIGVRNPTDPTDTLPFVLLTPRQPLTAVPFAQHAVEGAGWRDSGSGDLILDGFSGVGIGTNSAVTPLHVDGVIYSESGGFRFPDGSVQTSAAVGGGGNTLDEAYDQGGAGSGRTIVTDSGPVFLLGQDGLTIQGTSFNTTPFVVNQTAGGPVARFQVNGTESLYIDNQGDVGIGTSSAITALDVREPSQTANVFNLERSDSSAANADMLQIEAHPGAADNTQFIECERGSDIEFKVQGNGDVLADGTFAGPADFAEMVHVTTGAMSVEAGDVMVIDPGAERGFVKSEKARSSLVAGVYSTRPGFLGSEHDWDQLALQRGLVARPPAGGELALPSPFELGRMIDEVPLAVVGIVPCKVSAENGPIRAGDLLVTADLAGHAMRDDDARAGTIVGKALGALSSGTGVIRVLVTLQ